MTAMPHETPGIPAISLADARADLSKLANLAHYTGRPTILTRYGKPWAVVAPVSVLESLSTPTGDDVDVVALSERLAALGGSTVTTEDIIAAVREIREEGGA